MEAKPDGPLEVEGSNNVHYMWTTVGTDLLVIIHYEITRMPDGRLPRLARRICDAALPHARYAEVTDPVGRILRQTGALHLDPVCSRSPTSIAGRPAPAVAAAGARRTR